MAFIESPRFPDCVSYGMQFGPNFYTDVVQTNGGAEQRNARWLNPLSKGNVTQGSKTQEEANELQAFFRIAKGRLNGFRFKDWTDYQADVNSGILRPPAGMSGTDGYGNGGINYRLAKIYEADSLYTVRNIIKPVAAKFRGVTLNGVLQPSSYVTAFDSTTGLITVKNNLAGLTVAGMGVSVNTTISTSGAPHGLSIGDKFMVTGVVAPTQINGVILTVTAVPSSTMVATDFNGTGMGFWGGGGIWVQGPGPSDVVGWIGEFDIPCRFDIDNLPLTIDDQNAYTWSDIPIIELRQ